MFQVSDLPERLATRITIDEETGCWRVFPFSARNGYANISVKKRTTRVHRFVYELLIGPIPDEYVIDHVLARGCMYKNCANPYHLEPVTQQENTRRSVGSNATKTHCPAGHEYTEANTVVRKGDQGRARRQCKTCHRASAAKHYLKRKRDTMV